MRYIGSTLSPIGATSSNTSAPGIWGLSYIAQAIANAWPTIDPSWSSVVLLLNGNTRTGYSSSASSAVVSIPGTVVQNNVFVDSSILSIPITRSGTPTQTTYTNFATTAPYDAAVTGGSIYFNGTTDYLTFGGSTSHVMGTNADFTIECWAYFTSTGTTQKNIVDMWTNASGAYTTGQCYLALQTTGALTFNYATGLSTSASITTPGGYSPNTWYHIAVVRSGTATGNLRMYVNGTSAITSVGAVTQTIGVSSGGSIGRQTNPGTGNFMSGYISNVRFVKGTAVYLIPFTPPTVPLTAITNTSLLLNGTNFGFLDNAMKNTLIPGTAVRTTNAIYKYGTGSVYFNSTSITCRDNADIRLAAGNFTIEFWIYAASYSAAYGIIGKGAATTGWTINTTATGAVTFATDAGTGTNLLTSSTTLTANTWAHVAVVRSGSLTGNVKIYINGTAVATSTVALTTSYTNTDVMYIGADRLGTTTFAGYLDDVRITKNNARYTANFTPPGGQFPVRGP